MPALDTIELSTPIPGVAEITLNRPERRNAMTTRMFTELAEVVETVGGDASVRAVLLRGAGSSFCVGYDLAEIDLLLGLSPRERTAYQERSTAVVVGLRELPQPVVAAIRGPAAGGGMSLAVAADLRIATDSAVFSASFVKIGLSAGGIGLTWMLPRIVGLGHATEIVTTGRKIHAREAESIGLVNRTVDDGDLDDEALATCAAIAANSPLGVRASKRALQAGLDMPLRAAIELENRGQVHLMGAGDLDEALRARDAGRPPAFPDP